MSDLIEKTPAQVLNEFFEGRNQFNYGDTVVVRLKEAGYAIVDADEVRQLRFLLCMYYCDDMPYLDDGEMQDNSETPAIDFKRDSVKVLKDKMGQRAILLKAAEGE